MADHAAKKPPAPTPPPSNAFAEVIVALIVLILVLPLLGIFLNSGIGGQIPDLFLRIFSFMKMVSTIICMIALVIIVYAFIRISEISKEETEKLGLALTWNSERTQKNVRWEKVEQYMTSLNPSDWKIAILEADNILDEIVERMGYKGQNLGERMKQIEASDFPYLEEAWQAHKLRNQIAHKGTEYTLTRSDADQTINVYHRVFKELGYL